MRPDTLTQNSLPLLTVCLGLRAASTSPDECQEIGARLSFTTAWRR